MNKGNKNMQDEETDHEAEKRIMVALNHAFDRMSAPPSADDRKTFWRELRSVGWLIIEEDLFFSLADLYKNIPEV